MVIAQRQETELRPKEQEEPSVCQGLHKLRGAQITRGTEGNL